MADSSINTAGGLVKLFENADGTMSVATSGGTVTSVVASLPTANLGQQAMAASVSIVPASDITDATYIGDIKFGESLPAGTANIGVTKTFGYGVPLHGMLYAGTVATQMPNRTCDLVMFKAYPGNSGTVWVGGSAVTASGTATNTTSGYPLLAGDEIGWVATDNTNRFYYLSSGTLDHLAYFAR